MGTSTAMIDRTYGHMAQDSESTLRGLLSARSGNDVATADGADT